MLPGIVWVTLDSGESISGASGLAHVANKTVMTGDTRVQVGSVTKVLISMGVLRMVSTGALSLDQSVEALLPELSWQNAWRDRAPITIRHLLEHTSGLDNIRMWQFLSTRPTPSTPLIDAFSIGQSNLLTVRSEPGHQYSYSNMGYTLLGMVIEKISGERYEAYLARELLSPLGMQDSTFFFTTQSDDSRLAMGYVGKDLEQAAVPMFLRPAGQFTTTANDMRHLLQFLLGEGDIDGDAFVDSDLMQQLGRSTTTAASRAGLSIGHGLALAMRDRHGVIGDCHPGTTFGFRAYLCVFRDQQKAFFYAINGDIEGVDYERFNVHFIDKINMTVQPIELPSGAEVLAAYTGLYALAPSNMAQFAWLDWLFNSIWITQADTADGLLLQSLQSPDQLLLPLGEHTFRASERSIASHVFLGPDNRRLSNGLYTWERASLSLLLLSWISVLAGIIGFVFVLVRGGWLVLAGKMRAHAGLMLPFLTLVAMALPIGLFWQQSYLRFGELTVASGLFAVLTGLLSLSLGVSLLIETRRSERRWVDLFALVAALQLCVVLVFHDVLPIMFWR
ncbi:MAG: serine hydrolase domain-containing protein [Pseudomonadota bacterium]